MRYIAIPTRLEEESTLRTCMASRFTPPAESISYCMGLRIYQWACFFLLASFIGLRHDGFRGTKIFRKAASARQTREIDPAFLTMSV